MRTRLVRVRRRPKGMTWALIFLILSMALYVRVSLPTMRTFRQKAEDEVDRGERTTKEISLDPLSVWLVSFGGYETRAEAKVEAARYVPRGAAGYILDSDKLYVIGAGYAERTDAERACMLLKSREGMNCTVVEQAADGVTLRVTAGSGQIETFLTAEQAIRSTAGALGQLAVSIDRGDATAKQAAEVVKTHLKKIKTAEEALEKQITGTRNQLFEELLKMMSDMEEALEEMLPETGAMALSSRLKYCHIEFRVKEIRLMQNLISGQ